MDKLLSEEIERRMNNWAMAMASGYVGGGVAPGFNLMMSNQVREGSTIPVLQGEAEQTAKVLSLITRPQFNALCLHFVDRPPLHNRYQILRMTRMTYYRLVENSCRIFWKELNDLRRKERERERSMLDGMGKKTTIPAIVV